ncbi:hypothetical protein ABBQ38_008974 [Trebouxia sp. C0009 RCD-2024]
MSGQALRQCWHAYERSLQKHPIRTQALMTATLWAAGDFLAQRSQCLGRKEKRKYNYRRTAFTAAYGGALMGPLGHFWYQKLDQVVSSWLQPSTTAFIAAKVAADTLIYTPFNVGLFFTWITVVEGGTWTEVCHKLQQDFWPTMGAEVAVWPAYQAVNFARVPVHHQLLMCSVGTLFDSTFLCWVHDHHDWLSMLKPGLRSPRALSPIAVSSDTLLGSGK